MSFVTRILGRAGFVPREDLVQLTRQLATVSQQVTALEARSMPRMPPARASRSFNAAGMNRLTNDFLSPSTSADAELLTNLRTLRFRCRQLERNNDWIRRYLKLVENNVLGSEGIGLQMKSQDRNGALDVQFLEAHRAVVPPIGRA
jgi:capsid protein